LNFIYIKNETGIALKSIEIMDMFGRIVYRGSVTETETKITLQVANGIYTVRLVSQDDQNRIKKVSIIR
jgi:hypothetical protein